MFPRGEMKETSAEMWVITSLKICPQGAFTLIPVLAKFDGLVWMCTFEHPLTQKDTTNISYPTQADEPEGFTDGPLMGFFLQQWI